MSDSITIRLLAEPDLPAFKALRDTCLRAFPSAFTSDYSTEKTRSAESYAPRLGSPALGHCLWGAFDTNDQLLGCIALESERRPQQRHIGKVTAMMVHPAAQGQGIATQLIANLLINTAAIAYFDQLILTVTASNAHVVRLYEGAGFERYGLLPRAVCVEGVFHDKLLMRLDLNTYRNKNPV